MTTSSSWMLSRPILVNHEDCVDSSSWTSSTGIDLAVEHEDIDIPRGTYSCELREAEFLGGLG